MVPNNVSSDVGTPKYTPEVPSTASMSPLKPLRNATWTRHIDVSHHEFHKKSTRKTHQIPSPTRLLSASGMATPIIHMHRVHSRRS